MGRMDTRKFQTEIASPQRKTFYAVAGGDPSEVNRCLEAARKAVNPALYQLNYRQYGLEELNNSSWSRLAQELTANPFGQPPRIVVVSLMETEKLKSDNYDTLAELRPRIIRNCTLVVLFRSGIDGRLKFFKELAQADLVVDCQAPNVYNLPNWLMAKFKEKGQRIGLEAARLMIDRAGTNLGVLLSEMEKLAIYPGTNVTITTDHVRSLVSLGATPQIYELNTPLAKGRLDKALPILTELLDSASPVSIMTVISGHFNELFRVKVILEACGGYAPDDTVVSETGLNPKRMKFFREELEFWTLSTLGQACSSIQEAIKSVLTGKVPDDVALGAMAVKLVALAKGQGESTLER
jgi:DNA polymerase-3 subunit delta